MTTNECKLAIIKHALSGGRIFGCLQHGLAFEELANMFANGDIDRPVFVAVAKDIGNLSALQQQLDKAGIIDRRDKKAQSISIWAGLTQ